MKIAVEFHILYLRLKATNLHIRHFDILMIIILNPNKKIFSVWVHSLAKCYSNYKMALRLSIFS